MIEPGGGEAASPTPQTPGDPLHPRVRMETTLGDIVLELDAEAAPLTVVNFVQYVRERFYDGAIFHRVLKDSMIQGGGYDADMEERLLSHPPPVSDPMKDGLPNERGTIAMIRGSGRLGAGTAQFYMNVVDNQRFDEVEGARSSCAFGRVVQGMETVERICSAPVGTHDKYAAGRSAVVPRTPVIIKSVRLLSPFDPIKAHAVAAAPAVAVSDQVEAVIEQLEKEAGAGFVTTESGLRYMDLEVGRGVEPLLTDNVEFHYRGQLIDGTEFEETYSREATVREVGRLIAGLREGMTTMREGGRRTLIIPPELGYGDRGIPGRIPPGATLIYEIELLGIQ